ncbi:translation initiation factor IF-2 [Catenibacillus scindens]|uniref:translation initiation factor IF-2 n=1 Tax=Catenibacillus scindens TaxID=673271 RepID=UPI003207FEC6
MSKIRVHELAKELGKSSRDVIYALKGHGIDVESHMSTITSESADKIRKYFTSDKTAKPESKPVQAGDNGRGEQRMNQTGQRENSRQENAGRQGQDRAANRFSGRGNDTRSRDRSGVDNTRNADSNRGADNGRGEGRTDNSRGNDNNRGGRFNRDGQKNFGDRSGGQRNSGDRSGGRFNNERNRSNDGRGNDNNRGGRFNRDGQKNFGDRNNGERNNNDRNNNDRNNNRGNAGGRFSNNGDRGGRPFNNNNRDNRSAGARGRGDRDNKFNLDSAINKEVVVTKDTTRENRRSYKDSRDKDRNSRDRENDKKNSRGRNTSVAKKPLTPPVQKPKPVVEKVTNIVLPETITLKELGDKMKVPGAEIVKKLFMAGKLVSLNTEITYDEAEEIALDYDILCEHEVVVDVIEEMLRDEEDNEKDLVERPPVVCVMGHVDHGKTSILDAIRKTSVTSGEAGGITQHIGAYVVDVNGQKITFLDTPGHEAFTAMRLRGAQSTDIAILVVAADDGVMPQTIEAINHAKAAEIEIIVAINKIDKPSANIDRVKQELTEYGLVAEDWGGQTIMVPVSAHTGEGLDELLDMILLVAEMRELKANPNRKARGLVLEAQLDKGRGPVATVLVQKGTLKVGDCLAVGTAFGKVRAMVDDKSRRVKEAGPSTPVEILGLNEVPQAGEIFVVTDTEKEARAMAETFIASNREKLLADTKTKLSLDGLFDQIQAGQIKELNIVVKADVQGSVEAVKQSLVKLSNEEVAVKVIHGGVGAINESDVTLAAASNAIIIGFNVRPDSMAKSVAEQEHVDMRLYRVIYNAIEDVEAAMKGMLDPTYEEKIIGHVEVRQTYKVSGVGTIIGGYVLDGKVLRNCKARLLRDNVVIYEGELASLKRFKDDVKEVNAGYECGMSLEKFNDVKEGDQVEMFIMEEVPR